MPGRVHQNDAQALSLASSIAAGDSVIPVNQSISGVETPISYVINSGGANEEIVTLTSKNTSTSPSQFEDVVRGCDGTADQSHSSGEVLTHEATARDFVDAPYVESDLWLKSVVYQTDFSNGLPSEFNVRSGNWSVTNNVLKVSNGGIVTVPMNLSEPWLVKARIWGYPTRHFINLIFQWTDASNYVVAGVQQDNNNMKIIQTDAGSKSVLTSSGSAKNQYPAEHNVWVGSFFNGDEQYLFHIPGYGHVRKPGAYPASTNAVGFESVPDVASYTLYVDNLIVYDITSRFNI